MDVQTHVMAKSMRIKAFVRTRFKDLLHSPTAKDSKIKEAFDSNTSGSLVKIEHLHTRLQPPNAVLLHHLHEFVNGARFGTWPISRD